VNGAVRLTAYVGAATTPNSKKSRTEYRELGPDGVGKAQWDARDGDHHLWVRGAVIKLPTGRKRMCVGQLHDGADDVGMILVDAGTNVESTFGDTGRPGRLTSALELGKIYEWMIRVTREGSQTLLRYYWDNMDTPGATQTWAGNTGCYFKFGNYQQSEPQYDSTGETAILDLLDSEIWHSGYPAPRPRHGVGAGSGIQAVVAITPAAFASLTAKDPRTLYLVGPLDGALTSQAMTHVAVMSEAQYGVIPSPDPRTIYLLVDGLLTPITLDSVVPITANAYQALSPKNPRALYVVTS
jgi:hypothetical protein